MKITRIEFQKDTDAVGFLTEDSNFENIPRIGDEICLLDDSGEIEMSGYVIGIRWYYGSTISIIVFLGEEEFLKP